MIRLELHEQLYFTDGQCAAFALALSETCGFAMREVRVRDPRYAEAHDYPADMEIEAHVFCVDEAGMAVDAEGRQTVARMLRGFGILEGYRHRIVEARPEGMDPDVLAFAERRISECEWAGRGAPDADGALAKRFSEARRDLGVAMAEEGWLRVPDAQESPGP